MKDVKKLIIAGGAVAVAAYFLMPPAGGATGGFGGGGGVPLLPTLGESGDSGEAAGAGVTYNFPAMPEMATSGWGIDPAVLGIKPDAEPKKAVVETSVFVPIWEMTPKGIADTHFKSFADPDMVNPYSFQGLTGIVPKDPNHFVFGGGKSGGKGFGGSWVDKVVIHKKASVPKKSVASHTSRSRGYSQMTGSNQVPGWKQVGAKKPTAPGQPDRY